jgi:hypothetical protein
MTPAKLAPLFETVEVTTKPSVPLEPILDPVIAPKKDAVTKILGFLAKLWSLCLHYIMQIITLPLLPLRHLPSRTYVRRVDTKGLHNLKKELRALEMELKREKRRNSMLPSEMKALVPAPAPLATAPPPPPKLLAPPPPPPPPPAPGLKMPVKSWRAGTASESAPVATVRAKAKPAAAKKGFDISADQIANVAGRLRKTSAAAPLPKSKTRSPSHQTQISPNNLSATLRARMLTRRSSLLQDDAENALNAKSRAEDGAKAPSPHGNGFKAILRKAPVNRSPGGTPYREPTQSKPNLPFNTGLADKNLVNSPPRSQEGF